MKYAFEGLWQAGHWECALSWKADISVQYPFLFIKIDHIHRPRVFQVQGSFKQ